jgi:hypothetical protein
MPGPGPRPARCCGRRHRRPGAAHRGGGAASASGEASALGKIVRAADRDFELLMESPLWDAMQLLNVTWGKDALPAVDG